MFMTLLILGLWEITVPIIIAGNSYDLWKGEKWIHWDTGDLAMQAVIAY